MAAGGRQSGHSRFMVTEWVLDGLAVAEHVPQPALAGGNHDRAGGIAAAEGNDLARNRGSLRPVRLFDAVERLACERIYSRKCRSRRRQRHEGASKPGESNARASHNCLCLNKFGGGLVIAQRNSPASDPWSIRVPL
jgi:hypothetical protein